MMKLRKNIIVSFIILVCCTLLFNYTYKEKIVVNNYVEKIPLAEEVNTTLVYWKTELSGSFAWNQNLKDYLTTNGIDIENVTKIKFNNISAIGEIADGNVKLDLSKNNDGSVIAIVVDDTLYIQYDGILYLNEDSGYLFYQFDKIQSIEGLEYVNTSQVTNMVAMFDEMSSLVELDLRSFDTSNVTNMAAMFRKMRSLSELDLTSFDTSQVSGMSSMFRAMESLTELDLSSFDTSNVTNMDYMFYYMKSLTKLDLSNFNTSNVTNMSYMFSGMKLLTDLDISNFNTSKVTKMQYMFGEIESAGAGMSSLTELDVSSFNTSNVTDMSSMFYGMSSLTEIDVNNFDTSNVTNMSRMFGEMKSLTKLDVSNFDTSQVTDMSHMFRYTRNLANIDLSSFDTGNVTNMAAMFQEMSFLTELDVSGFNTSQVTDMSSMFSGMSSLKRLDLSNFDTSKVMYMSSMFSGMSSLTELDLSNFDTSNVISMSSMFKEMSSLTELDVREFNTSQVNNMFHMFYYMKNVNAIDLSNFNTSNVTNMSSMFYGMSSVTELDVSNFDTSQVTDMSGMFEGMSSLIELDVNGFNTTQATDISRMFYRMSSLTELDLSNFDTSQVTNMDSMFNGMSSLTELDLSSFDTRNVTNMSWMFSGMDLIKKIFISEMFDISKVTSSSNMFLVNNKLTGWNGKMYSFFDNHDKTYARIDTPTQPGYFSGKVESEKYIVDNYDYYIYVGNKEINKELEKEITTSYGTDVIEDNKYKIYYENELIKEYDIVNVQSDDYDLIKDTIKVKNKTIEELLSKVNCINCEAKVYDGTNYLTEGTFGNNEYLLRIMYNEELLKEYALTFAVTGVTIDKENVRLGLEKKTTSQLTTTINPIVAENQNVTWESNDENVAKVDENGLVRSVGLGKTTITVTTEDGGYTDTVEVEVVELVTYGISYKDGDNVYTEYYEEDEEVTLKDDLTKKGYALIGWKYNDKEYKLTDTFIMPAEDIELNAKWEAIIPDIEETSEYILKDNMLTNIALGTKVEDFDLGLDEIYTTKIVSSKEKELLGTGDKVQIYLDNTLVVEYIVVIKGDVSGDGKATVADYSKAYQYFKKRITMEDCFIEASDVVKNDSVITMADVSKIYQFIKGRINTLD